MYSLTHSLISIHSPIYLSVYFTPLLNQLTFFLDSLYFPLLFMTFQTFLHTPAEVSCLLSTGAPHCQRKPTEPTIYCCLHLYSPSRSLLSLPRRRVKHEISTLGASGSDSAPGEILRQVRESPSLPPREK